MLWGLRCISIFLVRGLYLYLVRVAHLLVETHSSGGEVRGSVDGLVATGRQSWIENPYLQI